MPDTVLPMSRQERRAKWPYQEFSKFLDQVMIEAGIPLSTKGRPNTMVFEDITGVGSDRVSRWRSGYQQPTTDSLRVIAESLAPRMGADPIELQHELEVKAGRRSPVERPAPVASSETEVNRMIRLVDLALQRPNIKPEERRELEIEQARLQAMQRMNEETVSSVDEVLRRYGHGAA